MNECIEEYGYKIVRGFLSTDEINEIYKKCKKKESIGLGKDDDQVPGSQSFYMDEEISKLQFDLLCKVEEESGVKLYRTYTYWRVYKKGAVLLTHIDRDACEISVTLDVGGDPWGIYLMSRKNKVVEVKLQPGDALIYLGCERPHWRTEFKHDEHIQIFMHFVDMNGSRSWAKADNEGFLHGN